MAVVTNILDIPEWRALQREAELVRHLIGSGVTALGRANYADKAGEYYNAFFGLSIGLERLAKLILVADYAISNGGRMPDQQVVRSYGHDLSSLMEAVNSVCSSRDLNLTYRRPTSPISAKIIQRLDAFADAGRGRYANFRALGDPNLNLGAEEPVGRWWNEVAEAILSQHYQGRQQVKLEAQARHVGDLIGHHATVWHINETGEVMDDVETAAIRAGQNAIVQRWGRYYTLTLVRWLADVFCTLAREAHGNDIHAFFAVWEHFHTFTVEDEFLKTRKVWPLR